MSYLLEKASSPENLNAAWKRLKNDQAVWTIEISRWQMESNVAFHLLQLSEDLRTGVYCPDAVRFFPVAKASGKKRIISAYTLRDKVAQRAVLSVIQPLGEKIFHDDSFAYRPGKTIQMALDRVRQYLKCGMPYLVDADIKAFFDNIPHGRLIKSVKPVISDRNVMRIIKSWIDVGVVKRGILSKPKGIPQGAVISPFLCNVYLTVLDQYLSGRNLPFVRFADDFLVFTKNQKEAVSALNHVRTCLKKMGLEVNNNKTSIARSGPKVKFLGQYLPRV